MADERENVGIIMRKRRTVNDVAGKAGSARMRPGPLIILACLILLGLAGCGTRDNVTRPADDATASQTFYGEPETVLRSTKTALINFGFDIVSQQRPGPGIWSLKVKKTPTNDLPEEIEQIVVRKSEGREVQVHIMVRSSFFKPWPGRPAWADSFFTHVYELMP